MAGRGRAALVAVSRRGWGAYRWGMGHHVSATRPDGTPYEVALTEEEWAARLTPEERKVLRDGGTERPFVGEYTDTKEVGVYSCRACNAELFRSETKFDSHCGWPSFFSPLAGDSIIEIEDRSMGMKRTEVRCASCGSHLATSSPARATGRPRTCATASTRSACA